MHALSIWAGASCCGNARTPHLGDLRNLEASEANLRDIAIGGGRRIAAWTQYSVRERDNARWLVFSPTGAYVCMGRTVLGGKKDATSFYSLKLSFHFEVYLDINLRVIITNVA